ncbi:pyridoxal phosphate-dependent aminotransferase [Paramagnetospirillum magneticum]|uniref:Aminotransferase n=1 Tax=Paramagnetospirillum magneticum (strain ATCC 700264 / AMB-1) TaxID=342108 RepID=Q2W977_PARM1|nr:pyridoxal phosphate-dependent aminotransferase [Paramagnetospirillum magneticum]BAE49598.1 Aspartate aminotransferase [Paramagnetospirillum magneticum AMB-1]
MTEDLKFSARGRALVGQKMFAVLEQARRIETAGEKVYHLELGNPRLAPHPAMLSRTVQALVEREVGYTQSAGHPSLRQAIADLRARTWGHTVTEANVVISPANLIISQFLDLVCDPGDRVVFFTPAFPSYWAAAIHIGLKVESVPLDLATGYDLSDDAVDRALALAPKAIIVNSANNPTGAVYDRAQLERLAVECDRRGIWLLSDETYGEISFGRPFHTLGGLELPRLVVMSSFSKLFSVPGYRIGFLIAHPKVAEKFALSVSTLISCLPIFTQLGCVAALDHLDKYTEEVRHHCTVMTDWCSEALRKSQRLAFVPPKAGFYFFLDISACGLDDLSFSSMLLERHQTAVTPGSSFSPDMTGHIRIATCGAALDVHEGVRRVVALAESL